jgi:hypothetical protein
MSKAQIVKIIKTSRIEGEGTTENPTRIVDEYYDLDGELLFDSDNYLKDKIEDIIQIIDDMESLGENMINRVILKFKLREYG